MSTKQQTLLPRAIASWVEGRSNIFLEVVKKPLLFIQTGNISGALNRIINLALKVLTNWHDPPSRAYRRHL